MGRYAQQRNFERRRFRKRLMRSAAAEGATGSVGGRLIASVSCAISIVNQPSSPGDEGAAARVRRAALQADGLVGFGEPIDDADGTLSDRRVGNE